jgi:hypothetical protein
MGNLLEAADFLACEYCYWSQTFSSCTVDKDAFSFLALTFRCLVIFSLQAVLKLFVVSYVIKFDDEKNTCFILSLYSHPSVCHLLLKFWSLFPCFMSIELLFFKKY